MRCELCHTSICFSACLACALVVRFMRLPVRFGPRMPTSPNVSAVTMDYSRVEDGSAVGQTAASALRREAYFRSHGTTVLASRNPQRVVFKSKLALVARPSSARAGP